ncbi:hypothetical protein EJD97_018528 [Solanum chilense]|uniref:Uncharacterized protein n=1 Tax=Solanum chilense TaxID=4083 RepID=A0A6N2B3C0_SOLCI|nr:hypothetical protein EJD97_018528 [Solanum chilense]
MDNCEKNQNALQMSILYFIHTFVLAETNNTSKPIVNFLMFEDDVPLTLAANVHDSTYAQKVNYVISDIEELKDHLKNYVNKKFEELVILVKENHYQLMQSLHKQNINVDPKSSTFQFKNNHLHQYKLILGEHQVIDDTGDVVNDNFGVSVNEVGYQVNVNAESAYILCSEAHQEHQDLNEPIMDQDGADIVQHNIDRLCLIKEQ